MYKITMLEAAEMKLLKKMKTGNVYRRKELEAFSNSVDRDLGNLVASGRVKKLANSLYMKPEVSRFGALPADDKALVRAFLGDDRYLLTSFNHYNSLGLGLTQLSKETVVYNRKRHTKVKLGSRDFVFRVMREFPAKLSKEFLLVDLLNNLSEVGESTEDLLQNLSKKKSEFDSRKVLYMAAKYGKVRTKKFLSSLYA